MYLGHLAVVTAAVVMAAPATSAPGGDQILSNPQGLKWFICPSADETEAGMDCANVSVPLDWNKPDGPNITLSMNRAKAKIARSRIGYLIYNPGGPGDSAIDEVLEYTTGVSYIPSTILDHFDLIGLDPRGIGRSTPIKCDPKIWNNRPSLYPNTQAQFEELVRHNKDFAASCIARSGDLVGHVDTTSVAQDMEAVRIALGDEKLNFLGLSYGTVIAAAYAELYPQNIRSMVMDGVVDHSESEIIEDYTEYMAYEQEFIRFAQWCTTTENCKLYEKDILRMFDDLLQKSPIPAPGCEDNCRHNVTWEEFPINMQNMIITKEPTSSEDDKADTWYGLAENLAQAFDGNATSFSTKVANNEDFKGWQGLMVNCLDYPHGSRNISDLLYQQQLGFSAAPYTKGAQEAYIPSALCIGWPYPVQNPPHVSKVVGAPPILMVNAYYDPETPFSQAVAVQEQLPSAYLLVRNGDGHTSLNLKGHTSDAIAAYLVNLTIPPPNTVYND